uniref:Uncharacterized protein n=1 Tax=Cacopsylla melanoneura TaxID=428564 RepID=A0A8D8QAM4_9HEMI
MIIMNNPSALNLSPTDKKSFHYLPPKVKRLAPLDLSAVPLNLSPYRPIVSDVSPTRNVGTQTEATYVSPPTSENLLHWTTFPHNNMTFETSPTPLPKFATPLSVTPMYEVPGYTTPRIMVNTNQPVLCLTPSSPMTYITLMTPTETNHIRISNSPAVTSSTYQQSTYHSLTEYLKFHPPADLLSDTIDRVASNKNILPTFRPTSDRKKQHKKHVKPDRAPGRPAKRRKTQ